MDAATCRSAAAGRLGSVACGGAMAAAAALVAVNDPSADGSWLPGCTFHRLTGAWCPGCGLTRATHHLLRGDVAAALGSNLFTPFVLAAIVATWWTWTRRSFGLAPGRASLIFQRAAATDVAARRTAALLTVVVLYARAAQRAGVAVRRAGAVVRARSCVSRRGRRLRCRRGSGRRVASALEWWACTSRWWRPTVVETPGATRRRTRPAPAVVVGPARRP